MLANRALWTGRHTYLWDGGRRFDVYERFFVATTKVDCITPKAQDAYVLGHRWWTPAAIESSDEQFAPRRLSDLLGDIVRGNYPAPPIDCGV